MFQKAELFQCRLCFQVFDILAYFLQQHAMPTNIQQALQALKLLKRCIVAIGNELVQARNRFADLFAVCRNRCRTKRHTSCRTRDARAYESIGLGQLQQQLRELL